MDYQHILVAIELSQDTNILIDRATFFAKKLDADLSFVYIDGTHGEIYPELVDIKQTNEELPFNDEALKQLNEFESYANHTIKHVFVGTGDLTNKLQETVEAYKVDFLICGHHHDFWSKIISHSKQLIDKSPVDILVVPIE